MGSATVRSSLEVMLDALKQKDDVQPPESLPALPTRPVSRGRLPPSRRAVSSTVNIESSEKEIKKKKIEFCVKSCEEKNSGEVNGLIHSAKDAKLFENVHILRKGLRVWYCFPDAKLEQGNIRSVLGDVVEIIFSDGAVLKESAKNLFPANPDIFVGADDLLELSYLNVPSLVHHLQIRYSCDIIYTKLGRIMVALNPFKEMSIYGNSFIKAYMKKSMDSPHIFSVACAAYNKMMIDGKNQSVIMSGKSGAGKSETAKFVMQYLSSLGDGSGINNTIMQSNLILESFGNARTLRNHNSSQYGKLFKVKFDDTGKICGAKIQTFHLDKSRIIERSIGERSYHVLYQLCAGASTHLREKLNLKDASDYEYLKYCNCLKTDNNDDAQRFHKLMEAMNAVEISKIDQDNAFAMLALVLWLGNIGFSVIDGENHVEVDSGEGVTNAAKLIGCEVSDLMSTLSTRQHKLGAKSSVKKLTLSQAINIRDALAKSIYECLFGWLVEQLNSCLTEVGCCSTKSISILDCFGFESFQKNGFEQLCRNYTNERLQKYFTWHVHKFEQEEYSQNGIDWTNLDSLGNMDCLNLFEKKPNGLLSLLDEESSSEEKTSNISFANKLKQHLGTNACFKGESCGYFTIRHFAGEVSYNASDFLENNADFVQSDLIKLFSPSSCQFIQLFSHKINMANYSDQLGVGSKLKDQVSEILQQFENTTPHFIRCIKPNCRNVPEIYENKEVIEQMRCCGILEAVEIASSGYPSRMTYQKFSKRYGVFLFASQNPLGVSVNILERFNVLPDMYKLGCMKIFFRTGQIANLEEIRHRTLLGITYIQKHFRGLKARCYFQQLKKGVNILQKFTRGWLARKHLSSFKPMDRLNNNHENLQELVVKMEEQPQDRDEVVEELKKRMLKAEDEVKCKQEENLVLKQQIHQYEAKMKSMEETWKKQMTSLQISLGEAKIALADERATKQVQYYELQDFRSASVLSHLVNELEMQQKGFEDEAKCVHDSSMDQEEELRNLKEKFTAWKREYKAKLRDAKLEVQKQGNADRAKNRKKWWGLP